MRKGPSRAVWIIAWHSLWAVASGLEWLKSKVEVVAVEALLRAKPAEDIVDIASSAHSVEEA